MAGIDPTTVRLSDHFLLSDFMGCDSVYRHGYPNPFTTDDTDKLRQGEKLADELGNLYRCYGPLSVTYGYISPQLSRRIVRYQDPNKPSFHRWDLGAAADICPHYWLAEDVEGGSPIEFVNEICTYGHPFDRIITYAESEILCMAWSDMGREPMNKVYENRFVQGQRKPEFKKYPTTNDPARALLLNQAAEAVSSTWRGQGWPRYHGGGRRQYEHYRIGRLTLLSDFLYSPTKVHRGEPNRPPTGAKAQLVIAEAAAFNDELQAACALHRARPSIVVAIDCNTRTWEDYFILDYVPSPAMPDPIEVFSAAAGTSIASIASVSRVKMKKGEDRIRVVGSKL